MNPFTQLADTLSAKGQRRVVHRLAGGAKPQRTNKTQAMRDYLQKVGPANAEVLAEEVGLERTDLVSALLAKDLKSGRLERVGSQYRFNHQYDHTVRTGAQDMANTLRRAGWTVMPPKTEEAPEGPLTETITWFDVEQGGPMPDAFTCVLLELEDSDEPVWAGCWDGERWCDTYGDPINDLVSAWAHMPFGRSGERCHG